MTFLPFKLVSLLFGGLLFIFGVAFYFVYHPLVFQYVVENSIAILTPNSAYYQIWNEKSEGLRCDIYLWEITNVPAFLRGERPKLREHGPFVFREQTIRSNITWLENNRRISYNEKLRPIFKPKESSAGLKSYKISVINLPFFAIMNQLLSILEKSSLLRLVSPIVNSVMKQILTLYGERLVERRSPYDLIFGRRMRMISSLQSILVPLSSLSERIKESLAQIPEKFPGYYTDTIGGPIELHTGLRNFDDMYIEFNEFQKQEKLLARSINGSIGDRNTIVPKWKESRMPMGYYGIRGKIVNDIFPDLSCNKIEGQVGPLFHNLDVRRQRDLRVYADICRSLVLVHDRQLNLHGYPIEQYTFDPYTFSQLKDENWCYCENCIGNCRRTSSKSRNQILPQVEKTNATVLPQSLFRHRLLRRCSGSQSLESCLGGPLEFSFPHFMYARQLQKKIRSGLEPNVERHKTRINIDPLTGMAVGGYIKFQLVINLSRTKSIANYQNISTMKMPYLWMDKGGEPTLDQEIALVRVLFVLYNFRQLGLVFIFLGLVILVLACSVSFKNQIGGQKHKNQANSKSQLDTADVDSQYRLYYINQLTPDKKYTLASQKFYESNWQKKGQNYYGKIPRGEYLNQFSSKHLPAVQ